MGIKDSYTYDGVIIEIHNDLNIHRLTEALYEIVIKYDLYEEEGD